MNDKVIGINEIKSIVPFRPPYLMVDRAVISADGTEINGIKAISGNEVVFCGHFPNQAIMPGVLQVEAMTQLGLLASHHHAKYAFVREASRIKFRTPVVPGDILEMNAVITDNTDDKITMKATAKVDGKVVSQAQLVIELMDDDSYFQPKVLSPEPKFPGEAILDLEGIRAVIPHRFPFQLLDRTTFMGETEDGCPEIIGSKNVTFNEPYFASIKNEMPFMPNYLMMEIAAQLGCIRKLSVPEFAGKLGVYLGIDTARFYSPILPGDRLVIHVIETAFKSGFGKCHAEAFVGEEMVADMHIKYALVEAKS